MVNLVEKILSTLMSDWQLIVKHIKNSYESPIIENPIKIVNSSELIS
jgi:hypothetical protein